MDELNNSQRNSIWASLFEFEDACRQTKKWLINGDDAGILYSQKMHLNSSEREEILKQVQSGLQKIRILKRKYDLETSQESIERKILALMSHSWANLCDTKSKHLNGYGELSPKLSTEIDREMGYLSDLSMQIYKIIENAIRPSHK